MQVKEITDHHFRLALAVGIAFVRQADVHPDIQVWGQLVYISGTEGGCNGFQVIGNGIEAVSKRIPKVSDRIPTVSDRITGCAEGYKNKGNAGKGPPHNGFHGNKVYQPVQSEKYAKVNPLREIRMIKQGNSTNFEAFTKIPSG